MAKTKKENTSSSYDNICLQITSNDLYPIYLLTGSEPYYIDKLCSLFESVLKEEEKDFNQTIVYGKDLVVEEIIATARQYPVFAERRLVIIKEAQIADKRLFEKAIVYLQNPNPQTTMVICNKSDTFPAAAKKAIASKGIVFESKTIYESKVPAWIDDHLRQENLRAEAGVSQIIAELLGNDLQKISNEISKLALNLKQPLITLADVKNYIGVSKNYNVFELQEALAKRNIAKANRIVAHFAANPKDYPIQMILPNLFSYFVKVIKVSQLAEKSSTNIAHATGVPVFMTDNYRSAAFIYPLPKLFSIIAAIREYDMKSKGVNNSPMATDGDLLKELVFKILY
ncbi:MAG: DNA polymerase III subunit delta [Bacteroidales bacterium]|jgi:DNA polymerase-3 subunit delta|nr:DNA polymerase III subunit delta [Bacteroidales bacterium]